jgi:2-hydroxy-3-keto-5-methylthiopentenyl-1-phosphate phosphatase
LKSGIVHPDDKVHHKSVIANKEFSLYMPSTKAKILVQCDFDNTIAADDVSFALLDAFAEGDWRQYLQLYHERKIPVGVFSSKTFSLVKADKQTMLDFIFKKNRVKIREGFRELLDYCARKGFKFVVVSNGLSFYIEAILEDMGIKNIEVFAAETEFHPEGLVVKYFGPDGRQLQDNFKKSYVEWHLSQGYRVIYIGDGLSDIIPASFAHHVFARDDLLTDCRKKNCKYTPFNDLNDVVKGLEILA